MRNKLTFYCALLLTVCLYKPGYTIESICNLGSDNYIDVQKHCGLSGQASIDQTDQIQKILTQACEENRRVYFPEGSYLITHQLNCQPREGQPSTFIYLQGAGPEKTQFVWAGNNASESIFFTDGLRESVLENFSIKVTRPVTSAIDLYRKMLTSKNTIWKVNIFGQALMDYGVRIYNKPGEGNNEFHSLTEVKVYDYNQSAFSINHSQAKTIRFIESECHGGAKGQTCVTTADRQFEDRGSYVWVGGKGSNNHTADFYLGSNNDTIAIYGGEFHHSARLLLTGPDDPATTFGSAHNWNVLVDGVTWGSEGLSPDGRAIVFIYRGPFMVRNTQLGNDPQKRLWIDFHTYLNIGAFHLENTTIYSSLENPFAVDGNRGLLSLHPTSYHDNILIGPEDTTELMPFFTPIYADDLETLIVKAQRHGTSVDHYQFKYIGNLKRITGGVVGQTIWLLSQKSFTLHHTASIRLNNDTNLTMKTGQIIALTQFEPGIWSQVEFHE